ncbi:MAG: DUF4038 domain-containing protein [Planctomycetota bacterium]|nr:DUF4038 domain-containing protein [Planctomycetota bacterium]
MKMKMILLSALIGLTAASAIGAEQWDVFETSFTSGQKYGNPFLDVQVDVVFRSGDQQWVVPAFWAGGSKWAVRFAPPVQGEYTFRVQCSDQKNTGLNGHEKALRVASYAGNNPLLKHGFLRVSADKRHFEHADGAPFFWLGDTWWKCLCKRMSWEGFQELTADRKAKGFSVVQIVCGPYPDEGIFEERWENEGGKPYLTRDFSMVNLKYFEYADRRIKHLVENGIVPAIVGGWGRRDCDGMTIAGVDGMKRHWRNLIARYGAYPTAWIIGGESRGPAWSEVAKHVKSLDIYDGPLTIHPPCGVPCDRSVFNFEMLQTGHGGLHYGVPTPGTNAIPQLQTAIERNPAMPVLIGEFCYEGHMQEGAPDVQRHVFWGSVLTGSAGLTYGAAGVWHASVEGDPGTAGIYDFTTWKEGMNYPGAAQLGRGKKLLEQYQWWRFQPHPEWVDKDCFAAGIPGEVRFVYQPKRGIYNWSATVVKGLEPDVDWYVYYWDPVAGRKFDQGTIKATAKTGDKDAKPVSFKKNVPSPQDWVLVFERMKEPIQLHPDNPHYFLWRGKPTVLITSGEHYGAVLNRPFNYVKYLDTLQKCGFNHTRLFMGLYEEDNAHLKDGPQAGNSLDPAPGQLICPFARSDVPGYAKGGNKFDLKRWDEAFFVRLKDFVAKAAQRGVVVEVNLFCPYYKESMWKLSPFNSANNVNDLGHCKLTDVFTMDHHDGLLAVQEAMVRRIVRELRDFDNIYYEICNEPYFAGVTMAWQRRIAEVITAAEKEFPHQHLISQNIANAGNTGLRRGFDIKVHDPHPAVSIFNFHYAWPPNPVAPNYGLNKPIGDNETGFRGIADLPYRREAWEFILAGGALFNHLDYSFTVGHEDGSFVFPRKQIGGGSPAIREQLRILKDFIEGFDFIHMKPDTAVVKGSVPNGGAVHVLAKVGEEYALYLHGGTKTVLSLDLPAGRYRAEWVNTLLGTVDKAEDVTHGGCVLALESPEYRDDVALRVKKAR